MNNSKNSEASHSNELIIVYLKAIETKIIALELQNAGLQKQISAIQKTLLIGRVVVTVVGAIVAMGWWLLEHSVALSDIYFKFIEGKVSYDNTRHSK